MDEIVSNVLKLAEPAVRTSLASGPADQQDLLFTAARQCLSTRLAPILSRVFVVEFHSYRELLGLPADPGSSAAISRYVDEFDERVARDWLDRYPVLDTTLATLTELTCAHLVEVSSRLSNDLPELAALGWVHPTAGLRSLRTTSGDPHQGGRMVTAVDLDDGATVIYKPRPLSPETFTRFCFAQVTRASGLDLIECAPESIDRGSYGWQRCVEPRPARDHRQVEEYYRRLGGMCAVLTALGASDMHHDNILAVGDHPVAIDLETVLRCERSISCDHVDGGLSSRLNRSIASTLLLPQRMAAGPYSVLMAGVGVPYEQCSERTDFIMVRQGTDAVDIAKNTYEFTQSRNILRTADGEATSVLDFHEEFLTGFRTARRGLDDVKDAVLQRLSVEGVSVRTIFRGTATYCNLMDAARHPDNLKDPADFRRILGMLRAPAACTTRAGQDFVQRAEEAAMLIGDVPYFSMNSADLRVEANGQLSPPVADLTPFDRAVKGFQLLCDEHGAVEELLIDEGFAELRALRSEHDPDHVHRCGQGPFAHCFGADGIDVEAGLEVLQKTAVTVDGVEGSETGWFIGNFGPQVFTFDPGTATSLHDAGGLHVVFERAAAYGLVPREQFRSVARGLRSLYRQHREVIAPVPWSIVSGPPSLDYLFHHAADQPPPTSIPELQVLRGNAEPDLMKELPGIGLLLAGFPGVADSTLQTLLAAIPATGAARGQWELAHGDLGLTWARHRLMRRLGLEDEARALAEQVSGRLPDLPDDLCTAWCSGSAGVLLIGAELGFGDAELKELAEHACALPPLDRPIDLSVCHGSSGVVQALVHVAQRTGARWALDLAADFWGRTGKQAQDVGFFTSEPARQSMLGYFLGWSGVLDTALLLRGALAGDRVWVPTAFQAGPVRS